MALNVAAAIPITLKADGTLTVADDYYKLTVPFDGSIVQVDCNLGTVGTTSGNTDFVVEDETDGDLWTVAASVGRIAYGSTTLTFYAASMDRTVVEAGQVLTLNVNVIDGGGTNGDLAVTLWVVPEQLM